MWPSPPAQVTYDFEMTYDAADGYVVLLGAPAAANGGLGPTEMWKFQAGTWSPLHPNKIPMNCPGSAFAYDDTDGYVLYLGAPNWGYAGAIKCTTANQTWSYVGGTWTHLHPAATPGGRYGAAIANDTSDGYVLLFGGSTPKCLCNDTWTYKGGNWTQLKLAVAPSPREEAGMAFDTADGYVLLFGGVNGVLGPPGLNDSWTYHAGKWKSLRIAHSPPGPEPDAFTYDAADKEVLYTTARNWSGPAHEISWTYRAGVWTDVTNFGTTGQIAPEERISGESAFDYGDGYVLFFGGDGTTLLNDSWSFHAGRWAELSPPGGRSGAAWAYDPSLRSIVLFGGYAPVAYSTTFLNDTWTWANGSWSFVPVSSGPSPRAYSTMVYDPAVGAMILFGGYVGYPAGGGGPQRPTNETWEFTGTAWKNATGSGGPSPRADAGMAYDAADRYLLLTGGLGSGGFLKDTWKFANGAWHQLRVSPAPSARAGAAVAYNPSTMQVVLFGGVARSKGGVTFALNDTWTFAGGSWTNASPASAPTPRANASLVYDARTGQTLLFGGTAPATGALNDTWSFSLGGWRSVALSPTPAPRALAGWAYDPAVRAAVLFAGTDGVQYFSDVWRLV